MLETLSKMKTKQDLMTFLELHYGKEVRERNIFDGNRLTSEGQVLYRNCFMNTQSTFDSFSASIGEMADNFVNFKTDISVPENKFDYQSMKRINPTEEARKNYMESGTKVWNNIKACLENICKKHEGFYIAQKNFKVNPDSDKTLEFRVVILSKFIECFVFMENYDERSKIIMAQ